MVDVWQGPVLVRDATTNCVWPGSVLVRDAVPIVTTRVKVSCPWQPPGTMRRQEHVRSPKQPSYLALARNC
jgi:hypothetical protein